MNKEILVLCPFGLDAGLVCKAASMGTVRLLVRQQDAQEAAQYGAQYIHTLDCEVSDEADFSKWLQKKIKHWACSVILAPATVWMRNIMPMLAWHLKAGLTADCTALQLEDGQLLQTRPAFGNSLVADIRSTSAISMATVRTGVFRTQRVEKDHYEIIPEDYQPLKQAVTRAGFEAFTQGLPLSQADMIIAGGLGIGSKEGFEKLRQLAQKLGAAVGASRSAVDAGYAPYSCQIGMTGVTVCPKLYIAVGISGAVQHLAGMSGAEKVIAINADPQAPIFDYADYSIVGDWEKVIESLEGLL